MPVDAAEVLLLLLTVRVSTAVGAVGAPLLERAADPLGSEIGFDALRPVPATVLPDFGFSPTMFARVVVAARTALLAGDAILIGDADFSGDVGRERCGLWAEPRGGRMGDGGTVRELDDFGDKTQDGLVTWRDCTAVVGLVRFLGVGNG